MVEEYRMDIAAGCANERSPKENPHSRISSLSPANDQNDAQRGPMRKAQTRKKHRTSSTILTPHLTVNQMGLFLFQNWPNSFKKVW